MRTRLFLLIAASAALASSPCAAAASKPASSGGYDQAALESYLKARASRVKDDHKARQDFLAKQAAQAGAFFEQIRDERNVFEMRMVRQRLNLFESLGSLNPKDHAEAIANFEKLQSNVTRSFETELKLKLNKFFSEREALWRSFAVNQEKAREAFAAEGEAAWQAQKAAVMKAAEARK